MVWSFWGRDFIIGLYGCGTIHVNGTAEGQTCRCGQEWLDVNFDTIMSAKRLHWSVGDASSPHFRDHFGNKRMDVPSIGDDGITTISTDKHETFVSSWLPPMAFARFLEISRTYFASPHAEGFQATIPFEGLKVEGALTKRPTLQQFWSDAGFRDRLVVEEQAIHFSFKWRVSDKNREASSESLGSKQKKKQGCLW